MIDSHFHLADEAFADDLETVVASAQAAGVGRGLCVLAGGRTDEAARAARLRTLWPEIRFAVGVHPHHAAEFGGRPDEAAAAVRRAIDAGPGVRAIGEIGLDYHYDFSPRDVQRDVFRAQVRLAGEVGLPVVIHTREADEDTIEILRDEGRGRVCGVFHCFSGDAAMARRALDLGFFVSFAGIVTFPKAAALRDAARVVPADRLLVETDSPYLAPVPHRGKRNEPAWVTHVVEAVAAARGEPRDAVADVTMRAFAELFGL